MAPRLTSLIQYTVLSLLGYILAGAPFSSFLFGSSSSSSSSSRNKSQAFTGDKSDSLIIPEHNLTCPHHGYQIHIFSRDPLIVYIESFLSGREAEHVVRMSEDKFTPATVWANGEEHLNPEIRNSEKALLDRDDVVQCIEQRARDFQGWRANVYIEKLWAQRYAVNGHYRHHYDWASSSSTSGRVSSFMVYLSANCSGGGTNFPRLKVPEGREWCRFLDCDGDGEEGVTFKPIKGNAVFWENLRPDGSGYRESWHAGLPVKEGVKVGLNIWSWLQPLGEM